MKCPCQSLPKAVRETAHHVKDCPALKALTKRGDDDWGPLLGPIANPPPNCS